ncbi:MAG: putative mannose-6-phosphate isomerase GmuF [Friedmanniella sp.]|nr:putative mannose-6-phosphate isomerase GmuF [Friedmanniella sp.]
MRPVLLPANQPADRFYLGGDRIAAFRGIAPTGPRTPEDWVGSTTSVRGHDDLGQTRLASGRLLRDEIQSDPTAWLGADHVAAFGPDTKMLFKLLDAGQRLPVHAHPDTGFAAAHLGERHGKAEAWYILQPGEVFLGLREDIDPDDLLRLVRGQQVEEMLSLMHRLEVHAHQTVFVPPGLLHAVGNGILLAEIQEPEDLSILLEWRDFALDGSRDGHLGLGIALALQAVETHGRTPSQMSELLVAEPRPGSVLVEAARTMFRLERVEVEPGAVTTLEEGFGVLVGLEGRVDLTGTDGSLTPVAAGQTVLLAHASGPLSARGAGVLLWARPPAAR